MSSETTAIRVENLSKYFREFWALDNITFEVQKGDTVGIIGRNGSGKSTLLQIISGTLTPTSGKVYTTGRIAALLELGSGFNPEFTGRENVYMNAALLGLNKSEVNERFNAITTFAEIGQFIDQPVKTYSSGMYVRLAFAVIAHVDADILIIDEALSVGDAFFTQKCMRFLREFMKTGTVLFVSHDISSVTNLCNHAIWLDEGKISKSGTPKEVCEMYLEGIYEEQKSSLMTGGASENINSQSLKVENKKIANDNGVKFDRYAASFGKGGAKIIDVQLLSHEEKPLSWILGGETVKLKVIVEVLQKLESPIIGFFVKDRLGQVLFGQNTFLFYKDSKLECDHGCQLHGNFVFEMPLLFAGNYTITVSIANGTQESHEQHHWIHEAVMFRSESSNLVTGLVGVPMLVVKMEKLEGTVHGL